MLEVSLEGGSLYARCHDAIEDCTFTFWVACGSGNETADSLAWRLAEQLMMRRKPVSPRPQDQLLIFERLVLRDASLQDASAELIHASGRLRQALHKAQHAAAMKRRAGGIPRGPELDAETRDAEPIEVVELEE